MKIYKDKYSINNYIDHGAFATCYNTNNKDIVALTSRFRTGYLKLLTMIAIDNFFIDKKIGRFLHNVIITDDSITLFVKKLCLFGNLNNRCFDVMFSDYSSVNYFYDKIYNKLFTSECFQYITDFFYSEFRIFIHLNDINSNNFGYYKNYIIPFDCFTDENYVKAKKEEYIDILEKYGYYIHID